MCGITGWVDFTRDVEQESHTIGAMTDTLALRGPDASGHWRHRHALLGHRRLAIIDVAGGVQPMSYRFTDGQEVALVYTGEVYNHNELRQSLSQAGHQFQTRSDTEVVLHAYLEWGEQCCEYLSGMFAFAVFDGRDGHFLLIRDRLGVKPLYYAPHGQGMLFGSEIKAILAHPGFTKTLDVVGLVDALSLSRGTARTALRGISELPPGHRLSWRPQGQPKLSRYWQLRRRIHEDDLQTTVERTRELLDKALGEQLYADVPVCSLLSGGLDSTILTALAQHRTKVDHGTTVNSFSVDFVGQDEQFQSDEFRPERDQPYALAAAEFIGSRHQTILIDNRELVADLARESVYRANDSAATFGDVDTSLYLLFKAIREHSTVAISGEAADEVFGGYAWFRNDQALAAPQFPWLSRMQLLQADLVSPELNCYCDFAQYQDNCYHQALDRVEHLPGDSPQERRLREFSHLHLHHWLPILLDRKDRLSMAASLEVRVPYTDHELVEYVYNIPWSIKGKEGQEKWLLKQAYADYLPPAVLERRKSPYPTSANLAYEHFLRERSLHLLNDSSNSVFQIIDHGGLTGELRQPPGYFNSQLRRNNLETALALASWLSMYGLSM
ncbi:TPA: asparagine synthase (glutamine-hydrolyzing) [Citrobacter freundii]|uniref:asparagine synthase (glutamine-hydrolyzing) n=1 Tax=Gammaproteobacteria TaxID=1236 RepID=UPI000796B8B7|nr:MULTISPECIES: asparagine synthase (glutamine-hydrolyzing) [Gammaproteobacteria]RQI36236.1 asparagine synthase (glutamine-hydrolyzing) [Pseudomonas aeruginosa]SAF37796.1 asparagine synthetase B [Enterobacter hormaechei]HBV8384425.1 asparagine synthase (glutamine-hydrolyzing) [Citrobacter freundii]HDY6068321.1 asparagine synthase (glutamine-hydrolyzing) [Pseudomonas aeruginosa]